jgi:hypothetical protein
MKTLLFSTATAALLVGSAFAQSTISAPNVHRHTYAPATHFESEGALQRGVRVGNPVQMVNPAAPAEYGDGRDFVTDRDQDPGLRPNDTSRPFPIGLRLFSIRF